MQVHTSKGIIEIPDMPTVDTIEHLKQTRKEERNQLLAETDWIVTKSLESGEAVPDEWKQYRQALRDIPTQPNFPDSIEWPTKPE
jgi:hypothetical protein